MIAGPARARMPDDRVVHRRCGRRDVVAVDRDVVDAVAGGPPLERRRVLGRCRRELGVAVVLAEEDHRQPPHGGEVDRLVEGALGDRAVAEERHRHAAVGAKLGGRCGSHRDRQAGGDDPVGAEDPEVRVGDVHRAAAATVGALLLAHQLGEHAERLQALGQAVAVAAMGGRDDVGRTERPARTYRCGLLADREVDEAGHLAVAVQRRPRAARTRGSAASAGASRGGRLSRTWERRRGRVHESCIVLVGTRSGRAMTEQIEIPDRFPAGGDVHRQACGAHRRRAGARASCSPMRSRGPGRWWCWWPAPRSEIKAVADGLAGPGARVQR